MSRHLFQRVSQQGKQTIPYLLMTTLKITFYKNIKCSCISKPSFSYLRLKKKGGGEFNVWTNVFSQQIIFFFTKTLMIMKMNVMISRMSFLILNKYWECHEITEYLKSKHVNQMKFLMAMRNMWWHFRFLFGQTNFRSVRQFF